MLITNDNAQNYLLWWLKLMVETFKYLTQLTNQSKINKVPKVVEPTNKEKLL